MIQTTLHSDIAELVLRPYVMALFDEEGGGGEGSAEGEGGSGEGSAEGEGSGGTAVATRPAARARTTTTTRSGTATRVESDDPAELRRALEDSDRRIRELNDENKKHRLTAKELKTELTTVSTSISLANQRAIRGETKVALAEAGAIDADVVDLLLKAAGDKIKIDPTTGDVVGVAEAIVEYKAKKPSFFKAAEAEKRADDEAAKEAEKTAAEEKAAAEKKAADEAEKNKTNATSSGASTAGAGGGTSTNFGGIPTLRNLTTEERAAAIKDYKRSLRKR